MGWTTPESWATNELVTAAKMNTNVRDNLAYLKDAPDFDSVPTASGTAVQLVPGTSKRHMESGQSAGTDVAVTFTAAYSSAPNVVVGASAAAASFYVSSLTTTGFVMGGTGTAFWVAEGPD